MDPWQHSTPAIMVALVMVHQAKPHLLCILLTWGRTLPDTRHRFQVVDTNPLLCLEPQLRRTMCLHLLKEIIKPSLVPVVLRHGEVQETPRACMAARRRLCLLIWAVPNQLQEMVLQDLVAIVATQRSTKAVMMLGWEPRWRVSELGLWLSLIMQINWDDNGMDIPSS